MIMSRQPLRARAAIARRFVVFAILYLSVPLISCLPVQGQPYAIVRGFVTDRPNGTGLPGANVAMRDAEGTLHAAATNADGFYQTARIAPGRYVLEVSFVGYRTHRDTVNIISGIQTYSVALVPVATPLDEVTVEAGRVVQDAEAGMRRIRAADIDRIPTPGPEGDLASSIASMPGVVALGDRGGQLYVRGGTPSQNLILVDGLPIVQPFHIVGSHSAFPADLVSTAEFYSGGYGARYMSRISSVLDVNLRAGNANRFEGRAGAGPFAVSARVEGPLRKGDISFLSYFRRSIIEDTAPHFIGTEAPYHFQNVTTKIHRRGDNSACSLLGIRTYDRGRIDPTRAHSFEWTNTVFGGRCLGFAPGSPHVFDIRLGVTAFSNTVLTEDGTARRAGTWRFYNVSDAHVSIPLGDLEWGFWSQVDGYTIDLREPYLGVSGQHEIFVTAGVHAGIITRPRDDLSVNATLGVRAPAMGSWPGLEPRLRLSWQPKIAGQTNLTAAAGIYRQSDEGISDSRDAGSVFVAWVPSRGALPEARHYILGLHQTLGPSLSTHVETYLKQFRSIPVAKWTPIVRFNTSVAEADGTAYGVDARLEYARGRFYAGLNYGWNVVEYQAAEDDLGAWGGGEVFAYHPPHDQRHTVGIVASLHAGLFDASMRWQLSTGLPFTTAYGYDTFLELRGLRDRPEESVGTPRMLYARPFSERLPAYHRLDVSVRRTFTFSDRLELTAEIGAMNAYDRQNLFYMDLYTLSRVDQLPFVPYAALSTSVR